MTPPGRNCSLPPDDGQHRIFLGRTGLGEQVDVRDVDCWLDFRFCDTDGEVRGFALNPFYAGQLFKALAETMVRRSERAMLEGQRR